LGYGYYNQASEISIRMLSRNGAIDKAFLTKRVREAIAYRKQWVGDAQAYRIVNSEVDRLPGFVLDRYGDVLVMQILTMGMERLRPVLIEILKEVFPGMALLDRSDAPSRRYERLADRVEWIVGNVSEVVIEEAGTKYKVLFGEGQKTGFYLDQRDNRVFLAEAGIKGKVLDAFCYSGGFGLALARKGCQVLGLDIQEEAIRQAEVNRALNGLSEPQIRFKMVNVFDELKELVKAGESYDLVILDPPSFVKKKDAVDAAVSGYKEILLRGLKLVNEGGLLAVFSCSYHVDEFLLLQTAMAAAFDAKKSIKIVKFLKQSADHPIDPFVPESYYLKGFLFQVTSV
jgi:23S rRNA (cytosine1962-C5)-methyltransferase